ncbi:PREDICTED: 2-oxoglutarate and iron-dependent oxygenase domain-containing protein 2 isoform X1 [Nanorana parkeri]|uniref:2-oxoglutarate and iron-dependent oxygenase domain-containing protein 2 isoform X1 n=1 Tax=Nanorana parkeri TaxID=125878 RepID=UPI0008544299|nr:PREDICTED: 2-oxoglutarate and iron-dependent oxygenase domain-containing protein 2 isoform X1 [Nanorana parkeri]
MAHSRGSYSCACFYTDNIYIEEYQMHVRYTDEQQFTQEYQKALQSRGCRTAEKLAQVLETVKKEVERRIQLAEESQQRKSEIALHYKPLHPELYVLQESFLAAEFLEAVHFCQSPHASLDGLLNLLDSIPDKRIYQLPVFVPQFCKDFVEELEHFERSALAKGRPNTMNNYGVLLNELGLDDSFITPLREKYLRPLVSLLYPDWGGSCLDSHKAFVVQYSLDKDLDLSCHYDNSEVTLNVSLGKEFTDGNLYFSEMREVPANERRYTEVEHLMGQGILHRGQQIHGALPITSGERWNLIIWKRASSVRNKLCPMCDKEPQLIETAGQGDGFTVREKEIGAQTLDVCAVF